LASHASALKAHRQSLKNREHNRQFRSRLRNALGAAVYSGEVLRKESELDELQQARARTAPDVQNSCLIAIQLQALERADVRALESKRLEGDAGVGQRIVSIGSVDLVITFVQPLTS